MSASASAIPASATPASVVNDRRLLLWLGGALILLIIGVSVLHPTGADEDPRPTTYNTGPDGAKGAYVTLERLGVPVSRWERPLIELETAEAAETTLVLAEPVYSGDERARIAETLHGFLLAGGRVLVTGDAATLVGGITGPSHNLSQLCDSEPEGPGPLSAAGSAQMKDEGSWSRLADGVKDTSDAEVRVEQRCGLDAVVVRFSVGSLQMAHAGEVVWWSSAAPLTNNGIRHDGNLRLLLASLGPGRRVIFDESLHNGRRGAFSVTEGLPLHSLIAQAVLLSLLLVFSFSRRRGPLRAPVELPRSSPVEFAGSMGDLYRKANATGAATEAARRNLERVLVREAHIPQTTLKTSHAAVAEALQSRFGGDWSTLAHHLGQAQEAALHDVSPGSAVTLVQELTADAERVRDAGRPRKAPPADHSEASL